MFKDNIYWPGGEGHEGTDCVLISLMTQAENIYNVFLAFAITERTFGLLKIIFGCVIKFGVATMFSQSLRNSPSSTLMQII